jgi:hypothetical protein
MLSRSRNFLLLSGDSAWHRNPEGFNIHPNIVAFQSRAIISLLDAFPGDPWWLEAQGLLGDRTPRKCPRVMDSKAYLTEGNFSEASCIWYINIVAFRINAVFYTFLAGGGAARLSAVHRWVAAIGRSLLVAHWAAVMFVVGVACDSAIQHSIIIRGWFIGWVFYQPTSLLTLIGCLSLDMICRFPECSAADVQRRWAAAQIVLRAEETHRRQLLKISG